MAAMLSDAELLRHLDQVGLRIAFSRPSGPAFTREWTWREVFGGQVPEWLFAPRPPWWLANGGGVADPPEWAWRGPLEAIVIEGRIVAGHEEVARSWIWPADS